MTQTLMPHLAQGTTTVARAWLLRRADGQVLGFTDHDRDLMFDGVTFRADSGLSARALSQASGLSVDNSEALGALRSDMIRAQDIDAGRYDHASVEIWLVNWRHPQQRHLLFRGSIGEIRCADGAFHAELRGLSEQLNRPMGRAYQKSCAVDLGSAPCGVDLSDPAHHLVTTVTAVHGETQLQLPAHSAFAQDHFLRGQLQVQSGVATGAKGVIKRDEIIGDQRRITLWEPLCPTPQPGDQLRLLVGCDKRFATCQARFANAVNFRGFPDLPGEDWISTVPAKSSRKSGGSRR